MNWVFGSLHFYLDLLVIALDLCASSLARVCFSSMEFMGFDCLVGF